MEDESQKSAVPRVAEAVRTILLPADWPSRFAAILIDVVVMALVAAVGGFVVVGMYPSGALSDFGPPPGAKGNWYGLTSLALPATIYAIFEGLAGTSFGKRLLKLRIESQDGTDLPNRRALNRALSKWSPVVAVFVVALAGFLSFQFGNIAREDRLEQFLLSVVVLLVSFTLVMHLLSLVFTRGVPMHDRIAGTYVCRRRPLTESTRGFEPLFKE